MAATYRSLPEVSWEFIDTADKPRYVGIIPWYVGIMPWYVGIIPWYVGIIPWYVGIIPWYVGIMPWYVKAKEKLSNLMFTAFKMPYY